MNQSDSKKGICAHLLLGALVLVGFLAVPLWADKGVIFLAGVALVHIVFALSFNTISGLSGMVSFGHAAYFAIGAYASGNYFAILTLAFAELLHILIAKSSWFGREDGLTGIQRPPVYVPGVGTVDLSQGNNMFYLVLGVSTLLVIGAWVIWHSRFGRQLAAIRQEPDRAVFLGINIHRSRLVAFTLSGVGAGFAGALYAPLAQLLTPEVAHWSFSALPILFCLLGGTAIFWGPVAGVLVFLGLQHATRNILGLSEVVIGATLLFVVLVFPGGIAGGLIRLRQVLGRRPDQPAAQALVKGVKP